jgi:hypothetical protein
MRLVASLSLVGLLLFVVAVQAQSKSDEKELRKIEDETARLEQQNDTALAKFLADDWVCACARELSKVFICCVARTWAPAGNV